MIDHALFKRFGLSDKEIVVYLAVLQKTNSGVRDIEKKTGIGRTHIYDITQKLVEKGFLFQTEKTNKRVFTATPPIQILEEQKRFLSDFEEHIEELTSLEGHDEERPKIVYYAGKNELETMHENFISNKTDKEAISFSDDSFYIKEGGYHQKKEISKRLKQNVHFRALAGMSDAVLASQKKDTEENRETRILPKDLFDLKAAVGVHGDKTVVVNNEKSYGFIVEDVDLADTIKKIFDVVWDSGRVIK